MKVYDFRVKTQDGGAFDLYRYMGKVLLAVNTATGCGFTPRYDELQDIYDEFKDKGLENQTAHAVPKQFYHIFSSISISTNLFFIFIVQIAVFILKKQYFMV